MLVRMWGKYYSCSRSVEVKSCIATVSGENPKGDNVSLITSPSKNYNQTLLKICF